MTPIRILHASDLHLAHYPKLRSFPDKFGDGIRSLLKDLKSRTVPLKSDLASKIGHRWAEVAAKASSYDPALLKRLAEFIYFEVDLNRLNSIILTGDLATTGDKKDIDKIDRFFNAPGNSRHPYISKQYKEGTLAFLPPHVQLKFFAGNHDRFVRTGSFGLTTIKDVRTPVRKIFDVGGTEFDRIRFAGDPEPKTPPVEKFLCGRTTRSSGKDLSVWMLTADFTLATFSDHRGLFGWLAQGKATTAIVDELVAKTKSITEKKGAAGEVRYILWACHFPPQFPNERRHSMLMGGDKLIKAANDLKVKAILTGHTHEQTRYSRPGMETEILCCGTTTQYEPHSMPGGRYETDLTKGNHFQVLNIEEDQNDEIVLTVENYRYGHCRSSGTESGMLSGPGGDQTGWARI